MDRPDSPRLSPGRLWPPVTAPTGAGRSADGSPPRPPTAEPARPLGLPPRASPGPAGLPPRLPLGDLKVRPYFSPKPHRITSQNLNDVLPLPGHASERICCRHLALNWLLQVMATGKPDYAMLGDAQALQQGLPPGLDDLHDRLLGAAQEVHLVPLNDWGRFAAAQLLALAAQGLPSTKCLMVLSGNHVMAWALKAKPGPGGEPRFVANFHDPNLTAAHKRVAAAHLQPFEALKAEDLFTDPHALRDYFGAETDAMVVTVPSDAAAGLPEAPPGGDPQRRLAGPLPPMRPSVMHHLGLGGFAGTLRDLRPAFAELAHRDPARAIEFLAGHSNDGVPALHIALQDGHAHVVAEFGRLLALAPFDEDDQAELLAACDAEGTSGLFMAMQDGQAEAVRAFVDCVAASGLPPARQVTLLSGRAPPHDLGLVLAMSPQGWPALQPFLDGLAAHHGLSLTDKAALLNLPSRDGRPALGHGLVRGEPQAVAALARWITQQGFSADDQCELLMAFDDDDTPALARAMDADRAASVGAFVDAVLASGLGADDKVHILGAGDAPGALLARARSRNCEAAVAAFRAGIQRSSLPADAQALLLQDASRRRRLR
jgi:hypothetical protein